MIRLFFFFIIAFIVTSCAQVGCPGGMCPPDKYYSSYKKAGRHGMKSTSNAYSNSKSFNRSKNLKTDWSRKSRTGRLKFWKNYESDKYAGQGNRGTRYYTSVEDEPFLKRKIRKKSANLESDKASGRGNAGSRYYTSVEDEPFLSKRGRKNKKNYESDKYAGSGKASNGNYTMIESNPFTRKKSKSYDYSRLLGTKKIKNKSRKGHQEGLFAGNVNRYQDRKTYHVRKRGRLADKVGVKKIR